MRTLIAIGLAWTAALLTPPATTAQAEPGLAAAVDSIFAAYDRPDAPGCAVGVIRDGAFVYARGYGMANLDYGVPLTADSKFYIASTSKQFTAACVALLVQQGQLSLDDDIRRYLPEMPDYGRTITVRHLVHHTSGLRDYLALMNLGGRSFEDYFDMAGAIRTIARQRALNFLPGEEYLYSNSGYLLLAEIVARVSGMSIRNFAKKHFFDPLGMNDTFFNDNRAQVTPGRVISYRPNWPHGFQQFVQNFDALGDGNLLTTVNDLARWDRNFYTGEAGGAAFLALMHSPGVLNSGDTLDYAFGLRRGRYRGLPTVDHGGAMLGFRTQLLRFPDQRFSVIVLANVNNANAGALAQQVADRLLAGVFPEGKPAKPAAAASPGSSAGKNAPEIPPFDPTVYVGDYYCSELEATYHLTAVAGALRLQIEYRELRPLTPTGSDAFSTLFGDIRFQRDAADRVTGFLLNSGRVKGLFFERAGLGRH